MLSLRPDLALISEWIQPKTHILDLGCGDGILLTYLQQSCQVTGYGLEIDETHIENCVKNGINVIHFDLNDLNTGLCDFLHSSFDYVVMTQALQTMRRPDLLLLEMLRVGSKGIVTFPNFGHWRCRISLGLQGIMPISSALPNEWYDTENIHLCTIRDFEQLCSDLGIEITKRAVVSSKHKSGLLMNISPNLFAEIAIYQICKAT